MTIRNFIILFFLTVAFSSFGQVARLSILKYFKGIEYNTDSTIRCAYNTKNGMKEGYSIEFDSTENPCYIGKYKKGKRDGAWLTSGNLRWYYKDGIKDMGAADPEGNNQIAFAQLYRKLLHLP